MNVIKDNQQARASLNFFDAAGNPTDVPKAAPSWASSDTAILTVVSQQDGSVIIAAAGKLGTAQVHAGITFDDGTTGNAVGDFQVVADSASTMQLNVETPTPKAAPAAAPAGDADAGAGAGSAS